MSKNGTGGGALPADSHRVVIAAEFERLPEVRRDLSGWAQRVGMSAEQIEALALASYEALSNAAAHAYPTTAAGTIEVSATYQPERALVQITVADHGRWRPERVARAGIGGRGLMLIRSLTDHTEVSTDAAGTTVRMSWTTDPAPATLPA